MYNCWERRRKLDFWLLAGMIGLWVYWLFLYRTGLLDGSAIRFYLWLFGRNIVPILLFSIALAVAFWFFRRRRWGIGMVIVLLTIAIGYWTYGPDFPKVQPLDPPKVLWQQLPSRIPVVLVISYAYQEELPPLPFIKIEYQLYRQKVWIKEGEIMNIRQQVQKALVELAQKAGEDSKIFEKCLTVAINYVSTITSEPCLPIFAEKRYEHVTGKLCWVFSFMKLRKEKVNSSSFLSLHYSARPWVAVRLRFPQKAWETYLAIEPEHALRDILLTLAVIAGYVVFLVGLRYVYDRWF